MCGLKEKKYNIYVKMEARIVRVVVSRSNTFNVGGGSFAIFKIAIKCQFMFVGIRGDKEWFGEFMASNKKVWDSGIPQSM